MNALWHVKVRNCCKTSYTSSVVVMCNVFWPFRSRTSRVGRTCRSSTDAKPDACRQHEGDEQQKCGETGGETSTSRTTSRKGEAARKTSSKLASAMRDSHGQFGITRLRWAVTARGKTLSPSSPTTCGKTMCCKSRFLHFQEDCCEDTTPNVSSATLMLSSPRTSSSTQTDKMLM